VEPAQYSRPYRAVLARADRGEKIPVIDLINAFADDPETAAACAKLKSGDVGDMTVEAFAAALRVPPAFVGILINAFAEIATGHIEAVVGILNPSPHSVH
jgi:hypothetical protein